MTPCPNCAAASLGTEAASICTHCGAASVAGASVSIQAVLLGVFAAAVAFTAARWMWKHASNALDVRRPALR
ncbi:MAG: hypothetical protein ACFCBV_03705 [Phycisphaerales bacterium]